MSKNNAPPTQNSDKLQVFLKDCATMGCLKGFQFFELYSRGREELIVTVKQSPSTIHPSVLSSQASSPQYLNSPGAPKFSTMEGGFPPASPCYKDPQHLAQDIVFLIGGYTRYKCPYVWVRSNHSQVLNKNKPPNTNKDTPLELVTTNKWKTETVKAWDIVEEIIRSCQYPPPKNPFKVDFSQLDPLPLMMKALATGALLHFLKKIYIRNPPYSDEVFSDISNLSDIHFTCMGELSVRKLQK